MYRRPLVRVLLGTPNMLKVVVFLRHSRPEVSKLRSRFLFLLFYNNCAIIYAVGYKNLLQFCTRVARQPAHVNRYSHFPKDVGSPCVRKLLEWHFKSYCEEYMAQHKKGDAGVPDGTVNCTVYTMSQTLWRTLKSED